VVGKGIVDCLVRVHRLDGNQALLLVHIEVQAQYDVELPERVYVYNTRADMRYPEPVISLVFLADDRPEWKPNVYNLLTFSSYKQVGIDTFE